MILAQEFSRSSKARAADFTTSRTERAVFDLQERRQAAPIVDVYDDTPEPALQRTVRVRGALIAQFAASDATTFADAVELIRPYVDGVDLNCGCPQPWAYSEHIGSYLLRQPDTVRDMIRAARARLGDENFPVSIKIRVDNDIQNTQRLVETAIHAGVSHITVHGRTRHQASTVPVSLPAIKSAVEFAAGRVPVVANGDVWSSQDVARIRAETGVHAVMAARGLLANPALFAGFEHTPDDAIKRFLQLAVDYGLQFGLVHRHIAFMLESRLSRPGMKHFNSLLSVSALIDWLEEHGIM
ncbi:FMN-linked oxidoreductase [Auriculariales sp. MPI-PUGE-AT-0066]|nr:FMN-linked oxidoreductase [Auriculariales sp. MPI-PUGE-AT-0066]